MLKELIRKITTIEQRSAIHRIIDDPFGRKAPGESTSSLKESIRQVKVTTGLSMKPWLRVIDALRRERRLSPIFLQIIDEHEVKLSGFHVHHYENEFVKENEEFLKAAAANLIISNALDTVEKFVSFYVQKKSIYQCRDSHVGGDYYADAEQDMDRQWTTLIYPYIKDFDFSSVLEIAPGHGRNSEKLSSLSKEIFLVDVNQTCIDACAKRFGSVFNNCRFSYFVTNGDSIPFIKDNSISLVYSFDSMVHFDKRVVRAYLHEFLRVLKPGGIGFLHHSNYGAIKPDSDWAKNFGSRSDVSAKIFSDYCEELGLKILSQTFHGIKEGRSIDNLDCVTILRKPV